MCHLYASSRPSLLSEEMLDLWEADLNEAVLGNTPYGPSGPMDVVSPAPRGIQPFLCIVAALLAHLALLATAMDTMQASRTPPNTPTILIS